MANKPLRHPRFSGHDRAVVPGKVSRFERLYRLIGEGLLSFEREFMREKKSFDDSFNEFRVSVVTVPVEVLESYLEDLLTWGVSDKDLCLYTGRFSLSAFRLPVVFLAAIAATIAIMLLHNYLDFSWGMTLPLLAVGVLIPSYIIPRMLLRRRFLFAQALSREINRRRGVDSEQMSQRGGKIVSSLFDWTTSSAQGAARVIYH